MQMPRLATSHDGGELGAKAGGSWWSWQMCRQTSPPFPTTHQGPHVMQSPTVFSGPAIFARLVVEGQVGHETALPATSRTWCACDVPIMQPTRCLLKRSVWKGNAIPYSCPLPAPPFSPPASWLLLIWHALRWRTAS